MLFLELSSQRSLPRWSLEDGLQVRLLEQAEKTATSDSPARRSSPIHPLAEQAVVPDFEDGSWFIPLLARSDTFITPGKRRVQPAAPLQSLTMMNNPFTLESAAHLVTRAGEMVRSDARTAKRIEAVYLLAFARKPNAAEIQWGEAHLKEQVRTYG
jgi:hypothetical protein